MADNQNSNGRSKYPFLAPEIADNSAQAYKSGLASWGNLIVPFKAHSVGNNIARQVMPFSMLRRC